MHLTRRSWAVSALAVVLAGYAIVVAEPLALAGAALIGAWILARQATFAKTLERTVDALAIDQRPARPGVRTVDSIPVTLTAALARPSPLALEVRAGLPTAARADGQLSVTIDPTTAASDADSVLETDSSDSTDSNDETDETDTDATDDEPASETETKSTLEHAISSTTATVSWPVAGRHRFTTPTVTATDGWFRETLSAGPAPTVTVEPPEPRSIHVGEGGDRVRSAYGEHRSDRHGSGLEPAEIREYMPGDTADHIDWKATARFASPHVREYEAETNRRTLLVVDHRSALATGRTRETKLDYLREVALAMAASARRLGDPVGLLTVGDEGITRRLDPIATPANYLTIRRRLLELEPTESVGSDDARDRSRTNANVNVNANATSRPSEAAARRAFATLEGDDSAFATTLRPFYGDRRTYRERLESDPLYGAVRTTLTRAYGAVMTVVFTDDSSPGELRETVKLAREKGNEVVVLLAPTVLYEPGGLADVERAYERYVAFEELRRELARMQRVTALEVGPGDRLATVLDVGRSRSRARRRRGRGVRP